jgi:succinate dehydrogenase/fumarate reductase cytochrome b subunit
MVPNDSLHFKDARLRVSPVFFGVRHLMVDWFYITAFLTIALMTWGMTVCLLAFLLVAKYANMVPEWL